MRTLLMMAIVAILLASCKKDSNETGVKLEVNGPGTYAIEIIVGNPVREITDINQWRPDVVFWANTQNAFIPLKAGDYTIVFQNPSTNKIVSQSIGVRYEQVVTININL